MAFIVKSNVTVSNLRVGPLSGGGNGGGGGASLHSSNVLFHYDIGDTNSYPGTGSTINDISGNGYNLTMSHTGNYISAGTSSYLDSFRIYETGLYPNMYGENGSPVSFTIAGWGNTGPNTNYGYELAGPANLPFIVFLVEPTQSSPKFYFRMKFKSSTSTNTMEVTYYIDDFYNNVVAHNNWFNFAFVVDATSGVQMFINGQEQNFYGPGYSNTTPIPLPSYIDTTEFGNSNGNGGLIFDTRVTQSQFGQLIFYNEALTASQVLGNYNALKSRYGY